MASPLRVRSLSLQTRWTAALVLASALPLGLLTWRTLGIQRRSVRDLERSTQLSAVDRLSSRIDATLDPAAEATHRVGLLLSEGRIADPELRLALARDTFARASALDAVAVYTARGALVDTVSRVDRPPLASLQRIPESMLNARDPEGAWLPLSDTARGPALRYVEPVQGPEGLRAWVVGTLDPAVLPELCRDESRSRYAADGRVLLTDTALRLVAGGSQRAGSSLAGRDLFSQRQGAFNFTNNVGVEVEAPQPDGSVLVGVLRTLPRHGIIVVVRRPEAEAFAEYYQARTRLLVALAASVVSALAFGLLVGWRTTRPVAALLGLTRAYAARRFGARSTVRSGDELELLGGALETMADELVAGEAELKRRARIEQDLSRYLPAEVARRVAAGEQPLGLGGERREVTVLLADVADFTAFAERSSPEAVVGFLNELFTVLTEVVFRHGGMVDKFMGDCVMAVFGAPGEAHGHAERALACAEDMQRFVETSAPAWKDTYGFDVRIGIGLNLGEALLGNLGSETRLEYTVIGDVVNVAARLEALCRGGQTLVTAAVAKRAGPGFVFTPLGTHPLRGKREPVELLELVP
ncbi:MAG: HAMP domain-containing protein [Deltaproteobacteria bacterium]|nr:HAMP domain-containing protein [Deltaproteobacteria bacterium]